MTFPVAKMLALCQELTHVFEDTVSVIFLKSFGEDFIQPKKNYTRSQDLAYILSWKVNNNGVCKKKNKTEEDFLCPVLLNNLFEVESTDSCY